ncbi:helix-turn-helix XRE-family transcriptional regulators [Candidatus Termititenax aidoneus]|uniref:Helix-turn-helix XRE-family transcriptional regulators n=1 Tax=Termititenax aidoneus TaxID=2218524 RepID=A0A388TEQ7_TERA1|nr:helix-turn-helix XRE-family transcriptional regulators [Candidatus Termititenax aidoneus]
MSDNLLAHIGGTIRTLRQAQKKSLEEIAFEANISYFYLSQIEHGQRNMTIKALYQIASALGVKPFSLLPENRISNAPQNKTNILKTLKQLTTQIKAL